VGPISARNRIRISVIDSTISPTPLHLPRHSVLTDTADTKRAGQPNCRQTTPSRALQPSAFRCQFGYGARFNDFAALPVSDHKNIKNRQSRKGPLARAFLVALDHGRCQLSHCRLPFASSAASQCRQENSRPTWRGLLGQAISAGRPMNRAAKNHSMYSSSNRLLTYRRVDQLSFSSAKLRLVRL